MLLCRFCGYLIEYESLGHAYHNHNSVLQACLDESLELRDKVERAGSRHDGAVIEAVLRAEVDGVCGATHGWEEAGEAAGAAGGAEEGDRLHHHQQHRRPKTLPRSIDECAQEFRDRAAGAGGALPPIPLLPVYKGRWCEEHQHPCISTKSIRTHVKEHGQAAPGFTEESMEEAYFLKLSDRPQKHDEHTVRVADPDARLLATADGKGLLQEDLAALTRICEAGLTGLNPTGTAHIPVLLRRLGWDAYLEELPLAALYQLTRRANECDDAVVLGAVAAPDPEPVAPRVKARELYASDVVQRFVMDVCRRARGADFFAARSHLGPGDERFEVPKDESVERNFAPHIARLVLFLMRIAALQSEGTDGGLQDALPPLEQRELLPAVQAFVSECAGDMPDEWVDFCRATARPPAIEVRMQRLRELRKEPEALAGKLHAMFKLLYITKWRLWYRPSSSHLVLFLLGSCCLDDDSFLPQYKIGARINPFIFLGRITVLNEMYEKGKLIAANDERAAKDGWRRLSEDEKQEMQELEKD